MAQPPPSRPVSASHFPGPWRELQPPANSQTLVILWVPPVVILGACAGAVLFGFVAVIVIFSPVRMEASPLSYAVLGSLLSLGIIIPFAAWMAGGYLRALHGAQGTYLLLPYVLLPLVIAGLLTGSKVRSGRSQFNRGALFDNLPNDNLPSSGRKP
jgi:hypothetical protein